MNEKEILNVYVNFPFDKEKDKDLFEHYCDISLLISQISMPLLEELNTKDVYHIVITRVTGDTVKPQQKGENEALRT